MIVVMVLVVVVAIHPLLWPDSFHIVEQQTGTTMTMLCWKELHLLFLCAHHTMSMMMMMMMMMVHRDDERNLVLLLCHRPL